MLNSYMLLKCKKILQNSIEFCKKNLTLHFLFFSFVFYNYKIKTKEMKTLQTKAYFYSPTTLTLLAAEYLC